MTMLCTGHWAHGAFSIPGYEHCQQQLSKYTNICPLKHRNYWKAVNNEDKNILMFLQVPLQVAKVPELQIIVNSKSQVSKSWKGTDTRRGDGGKQET